MSFRRKLLTAGLICASFSTALVGEIGSPAKAEDDKGWYLSIGGGASSIQDVDWDWSSYSGELQHDSGFSFEMGFGYDYGRSRGELTWVRNTGELDAITVDQAGTSVSVSGDTYTNGLMASYYYDLTDDDDSKFTPYIGAGLGISRTNWDDITVAGTNLGDSWVQHWAYQLKVGTTMEVSETNDLYIEGVYSGQPGFEDDGLDWGSVNAWSARAGIKFKL